MSFATHDLPLLAFLGASLCTPVQAADFDVGVSLVCDTQTQVERFVTLLTGDAQSAVDAVNAMEHNPTACALIDVAYFRGPRIEVARDGDSAFEIARILVVGIKTAIGIQTVQPAAYFSLFGIKEYAV
jgi:hypothetical protein